MRLDHEKVRWHRDRLGWTLDTLAEEANVAKGTVLRAEHGEDVRPSSGRRIARALEVEISDLIPDKPGSVGELVGVGKGETPREAGRLDHNQAAMLLEALRNARKLAQPLIEQDDQTIAASRQALERMKGGIGVSDAYFVEESPELAEVSPELAEVVDLALEREQHRRKMARSG